MCRIDKPAQGPEPALGLCLLLQCGHKEQKQSENEKYFTEPSKHQKKFCNSEYTRPQSVIVKKDCGVPLGCTGSEMSDFAQAK